MIQFRFFNNKSKEWGEWINYDKPYSLFPRNSGFLTFTQDKAYHIYFSLEDDVEVCEEWKNNKRFEFKIV